MPHIGLRRDTFAADHPATPVRAATSSLSVQPTAESLGARLQGLGADTPRQWGRISAHGMSCHLSDSFLMVPGDRPSYEPPTLLGRTLGRFLALHTEHWGPLFVPSDTPHRLPP